ncbi:aminodeoxychorismate synthase component I [Novosphingobium terrae]|uniref:aminodeoxychorismate synthase component I n=1 Tax=Novosphingobium terrae TaxID=2726189 RepID=UPI00197F4C92|nr:aminodeoxychorismate synthase component I [Novosphingobium terrae]
MPTVFPSCFALFQDASSRREKALYFADPQQIITAHTVDEVRPALDRLREAAGRGQWCAGALAYEAGYALEGRLKGVAYRPSSQPLMWFGVFEGPRPEGPPPLSPEAQDLALSPSITRKAYLEAIERVLDYIRQGDIYQMNLTFQAQLGKVLSPEGLYGAFQARQAARYGGLLATGAQTFASFSPELFFELQGGRITTRPMKGTAPRFPDAVADRQAAEALARDAKNRAENLMIVDLMRNDVTRIAAPGSVRVDRLFEIETFPTLHQMTSTVSAALREGLDAVDVIEALFPCGSITGAPKIRAMELIRTIEPAARGLYTGSMGWIAPSGDARFNVAIRTIAIGPDGHASIGLGSGVVADSKGPDEWQECLLKAHFLSRPQS